MSTRRQSRRAVVDANDEVEVRMPERQRRNRAVAEREASRLARPEGNVSALPLGHASRAKSAVSSTPVGTLTNRSNTTDNPVVEWCGPFSVARQMIAARDEARRQREAHLDDDHVQHPLDAAVEEVELEKKRKANPSMQWRGIVKDTKDGQLNYYVKRKKRFARQQQARTTVLKTSSGGKVPSLFNLCIQLIVDNFDNVESLGHDIDNNIRRTICSSLVANGKMNGAAFDTLAEVGIETLEIVDCAEVTQDQLADALHVLIPAGLKAILLNHAGRCFGPKAVDSIVTSSKKNGPSLFAVSIGGAYMLKDADAAMLIKAESPTLSSIEFRACPLLGTEFCSAIGLNFASGAGCLLELLLEEIPLTKEDLMSLGTSSDALRNLKCLTLKRMVALDDEVVSVLLSSESLEGINLSDNAELTDESLSCIRRCNINGALQALELSGLRNLTAPGLEALFTHGIPGLPNPPALRKLDLSSCGADVVNDKVVELACMASSMKKTSADDSTEPSDDTYVAGISAMGGLVYLNVNAGSVTDKSMEHLASTCALSLKELDLSFCAHMTDKGLGYLVSKAEDQFTKLHLWGCAQITDEFLDGHSRVEDGGLEIIGVWMKQSGRRSMR